MIMEKVSLSRKLRKQVKDCWLEDLGSVPNLIFDLVKEYSRINILPLDFYQGVIGVPDLDSLHFITLNYARFPDLEQGQVIALWDSKYFGCDYHCAASFVFDGHDLMVNPYHYPKIS